MTIKKKVILLVSLTYGITLFVLLLISSLFIQRIIDLEKHDNYHNRLKNIIRQITASYDEMVATGIPEYYEKHVKEKLFDHFSLGYKNIDTDSTLFVAHPFILDSNMRVILHNDLIADTPLFTDSTHMNMVLVLKNGEFKFSERGEKYWISFKTFEPWKWIIGYIIPINEMYKDVPRFRYTISLFMVGMVVVIGLILYVLLVSIFKPLSSLTVNMKAISHGSEDIVERLRYSSVQMPKKANNFFLTTLLQKVFLSHRKGRRISTQSQVAHEAITKEGKWELSDEIGILVMSFESMRKVVLNAIEKLENEITMRTLAEQNLRLSEEKYLDLFKSIPDPVFIIDKETDLILHCNDTALKSYGWSREELVGTEVKILLHHSDNENPKNRNRHTKNNDISEYVHITRDGVKRNVEVHSNVIPYENKKVYLSIVRDVTVRKQIEAELLRHRDHLTDLVEARTAELKNAQQQLIDKAHKAGMAEIATGTLHNIGNIINSVRVSGELLKDMISSSAVKNLNSANTLLCENINTIEQFILDDQRGKKLFKYYIAINEILLQENNQGAQHIERMVDKVEDIITLIQKLNSFTHVSQLVEPINVHKNIQSLLRPTFDTMLKKHTIHLSNSIPENATIKVVKNKFDFILTNILANAIESFSKESTQDKKTITLSLSDNDLFSVITITDNGCGISKDNLSGLFSNGYSTKENHSGFSLHTCANYLKEMGGDIHAESPGVNRGTSFHVSFKK